MKLTEELLKEMEKKKELYGDGIIMPDGDYRLIQDGQLVLVKIGKRSSGITADSINAMIERNRTTR